MEVARATLVGESGPGHDEGARPGPSIYTHKRIEFRPARKHYDGLGRGDAGFRIETLNPDPGRKRAASEAGLDTRPGTKRGGEGPDFGDSLLDPELGFGVAVSRIRKIGAGLENLGNTCYLNSVLQCLTYTEPLAAYLQSGKHQSSCHIAGFCALCAIQKHVSRALESSGRSLVPKDLVSNLRCISRNFRNARQEDAHEYMVNLLESMHKCCLPSGVPYESPAAYEKSLVHKIFGGRLRSQVECQQCFYRSDKFDPFLDVSLEIFKADSLPAALRNFTASEMLDGGEKHYQCQRCKDKVKAKKRLTVHKAPYVLTIHLKRFHALDPGRKVDRKVAFDNSLNLKPFYSGSHEGDLKYSLYGVLVHFGHNTHSGHYVCFVRTSSGIWYLLNDNEVRPVSEKTVLDQKAYMLFYVRDRKTVPMQKPGDVVKKENAKAIENLLFRQFTKEQASNISIETKANAAVSSTTAKKMNANKSDNFLAGASVQLNSMESLSDGTKLNKCSGWKPSSTSTPKHLLDRSMIKAESDSRPSSVSASNDQACPSSLSEDNTHSPFPPGTSVSCKSVAATNLTASRAIEMHVVSSAGNSSPCLAIISNQTSQMIDRVLPGRVPGKVPAEDTTNAAAEDAGRNSVLGDFRGNTIEMGLRQSPKEPSFAIYQGGGSCNGSACINSFSQNAHGMETLDESVTVSALKAQNGAVDVKDDGISKLSTSIVPNGTLTAEASDGPTNSTHFTQNRHSSGDSNCSAALVTEKETWNSKTSDSKSLNKSRKNLMRCAVPGLRLRVNLFLLSLDIQKRKKHRKCKRSIIHAKNLVRESLVDNSGCLQLKQVQSMHLDRNLVSGGTSSVSKISKSGLKDSYGSRKESRMGLADISSEIQMEANLKATELAVDKKSKKGTVSTSEASFEVAKQLDCTHDSKAMGVQMELSQGLRESKVARWDDVELPPASISDSNSSKIKSIGYVPDEWDEDYDRGKRKKIRQSKRMFGGPNPFQEIASRQARGQR